MHLNPVALPLPERKTPFPWTGGLRLTRFKQDARLRAWVGEGGFGAGVESVKNVKIIDLDFYF